MSADELDALRRRMKAAAWRWARDRTRDDVEAMAEDLEMAGWCGYYEHPEKPAPLRFIDAKRAMIREWIYWRFEMSRKALRLNAPVTWEGAELPLQLAGTDDTEANAATRELLTKLQQQMKINAVVGRRTGWRNPAQANHRRAHVLRELILDGGDFYHRQAGIPKSSFARHRRVIQEAFTEICRR